MKTIVMAMMAFLAFSSTVWADTYTLETYGDQHSITGSLGGTAVVTEFTQAMQTTVSSGSGVINPFLTIQANSTEQGFNTDGAMLYDQKRGAQPGLTDGYTRSLLAGDLGTFTVGSTTSSPGGYFNFLLDANEPKSDNKVLITLTEFQVFLVPNSVGGSLTDKADLTTYKMFDMGANSVIIDYSLWNGSGQNMDVLFQIPTFAVNANDYIYLWTKFTGTQDGYEEWASQSGPTPVVPEPGTMMLLGAGLLGLAIYGKRRMN